MTALPWPVPAGVPVFLWRFHSRPRKCSPEVGVIIAHGLHGVIDEGTDPGSQVSAGGPDEARGGALLFVRLQHAHKLASRVTLYFMKERTTDIGPASLECRKLWEHRCKPEGKGLPTQSYETECAKIKPPKKKGKKRVKKPRRPVKKPAQAPTVDGV